MPEKTPSEIWLEGVFPRYRAIVESIKTLAPAIHALKLGPFYFLAISCRMVLEFIAHNEPPIDETDEESKRALHCLVYSLIDLVRGELKYWEPNNNHNE